MISSNPKSSNPTRVAFVVHPISLWGEEMHVMSFRVRRNIFPIFEQTRQNRHEMTRAGVVQKAPDTFLRRGAYWTPSTDRHDTAMTHNDTHLFLVFFKKLQTPFDQHDMAMTRHDTYFWKQLWWHQEKCTCYYEYLTFGYFRTSKIKGCVMDTHAKGCLLGTRLYILV